MIAVRFTIEISYAFVPSPLFFSRSPRDFPGLREISRTVDRYSDASSTTAVRVERIVTLIHPVADTLAFASSARPVRCRCYFDFGLPFNVWTTSHLVGGHRRKTLGRKFLNREQGTRKRKIKILGGYNHARLSAVRVQEGEGALA